MTSWLDQINKHEVHLPKGITKAMNGRIPANLLVDVHDGNGKRIGRLNSTAARSFKAMVHQALLDGVPAAEITATDTYRTIESQQRLWDTRYDHTDHGNGGRTCGGDHRYLKDGEATAACPGTSKHGFAQAIDKGNGARWHAWLERKAGTYGWEWELKSEKWHLHYWPGDTIPQAVLDFEANTSEEDDNMKIIVPTGPGVAQRFPQANNVNHLVGGGRIVPFKNERQLAGLKKVYGEQHFVDDLTWDVIVATSAKG